MSKSDQYQILSKHYNAQPCAWFLECTAHCRVNYVSDNGIIIRMRGANKTFYSNWVDSNMCENHKLQSYDIITIYVVIRFAT